MAKEVRLDVESFYATNKSSDHAVAWSELFVRFVRDLKTKHLEKETLRLKLRI